MSSLSEGSTSPGSFRKASISTPRIVTIAEPGAISPLLTPLEETHISNLRVHSTKRHHASLSRRLSGRASVTSSPEASPNLTPYRPESSYEPTSTPGPSYEDLHGNLIKQIIEWLRDEKKKHQDGSGKKASSSSTSTSVQPWVKELQASPVPMAADSAKGKLAELAFESLEKIISDSASLAAKISHRTHGVNRHLLSRRKSSTTKRSRKASLGAPSSDTEYVDGDAFIPSTDVVLDNTKTLGYFGGAANENVELTRIVSARSAKEDNWIKFKNEIIRLAHTLRLKGWRYVPLDSGADVDVRRLSGALTNAVYTVSPPKHIIEITASTDSSTSSTVKRRPRTLLLRIYGPQVEHLIDRESELEILRRLARKNIGPRLLGTFRNGRFEEFLNAQTLTREDLWKPTVYKQIAKRMRELHDGIDLLEHERDRGPFVWQNWDRWVARCEEVITWLDKQILAHEGPVKSRDEMWKKRGFVCGVEWAQFRKAVDSYRRWLIKQYGGEDKIKARLIFAHNDTQYGNLLRLIPTGESPLLLPANEHKQLVVIDFEYANANVPGMEFANHFTEWCYNYHSQTNSYACNTAAYPTAKDQQRFLFAYVQHTANSMPQTEKLPHQKSTSSISSFMLDSRGPINQYDAEEAAREEQAQAEVERLMKETRLWRIANSAQWVAWGIVQAKVPGMDTALEESKRKVSPHTTDANPRPEAISRSDQHNAGIQAVGKSTPATPSQQDGTSTNNLTSIETEEPGLPHENETEDDSEFDYLAYAQQRALFFWGDLLELGLVKDEDLPEDVVRNAKRVPY